MQIYYEYKITFNDINLYITINMLSNLSTLPSRPKELQNTID